MPQPRIDEIDPRRGWPGTLVTIRGDGFDAARDGNLVMIGNERALVVRASPQELLVMAGEGTAGGQLSVKVGADVADGGVFELSEHPDPSDPLVRPAPRFFHGPQHGTPSTNVKDQRILILPVYPTDHPPVAPVFGMLDPLTLLDQKYSKVGEFWRTASFDSTTWKFERHPNWLPLPKAGSHYIVDQSHIDAARYRYLTGAKRITGYASLIVGTSNLPGVSPVVHGSPLTWTYHVSQAPDNHVALAVRMDGPTLYVGTSGGRFAIYDMSNPAMVRLIGASDAGSPVWDIALVENHAVLALGSAGLGLMDITNPASPALLIPGPDNDARWTTRVKAVGNRIYSSRGDQLEVHDLTGLLTFASIASLPAKAWITDIDVSGTVCAVATDGAGLALFEVTPAGLLEKGWHNEFRFLREVRLAGTTAFVAASEDGLVAIDVSDRGNPSTLGQLKFQKDANSLVLKGAEAVVAVGSAVLVSANIADPAAMALQGAEAATDFNIPLADSRSVLQQTINDRNSAVDFDRMSIDALRAWFAAAGTSPSSLDPYDGIVVSFYAPGVRAHSGVFGGLKAQSDEIVFNAAKGVFYEHRGGAWTTPTHELVHWLNMGDLYEEAYADGSVIVGSAGKWCISGSSGQAPLFCSQRMTDILNWYSVGISPADNVRELKWSPTSQVDQTFEVVAHGAAQDLDPNRVHALRLIVSSGMTYWVEVRQLAPPGLPFDKNIPVPPGAPGCVLVTRATDEQSVVDNTLERPIQLVGILGIGDTAVDASRNLTIRVEDKVQADPLAYRVRVEWNQPIPDNPDGAFDLAITPWNTTTYETPDIWVDSTRRNPEFSYEFHEPGDRGIL